MTVFRFYTRAKLTQVDWKCRPIHTYISTHIYVLSISRLSNVHGLVYIYLLGSCNIFNEIDNGSSLRWSSMDLQKNDNFVECMIEKVPGTSRPTRRLSSIPRGPSHTVALHAGGFGSDSTPYVWTRSFTLYYIGKQIAYRSIDIGHNCRPTYTVITLIIIIIAVVWHRISYTCSGLVVTSDTVSEWSYVLWTICMDFVPFLYAHIVSTPRHFY